jgi:hypothetical protein
MAIALLIVFAIAAYFLVGFVLMIYHLRHDTAGEAVLIAPHYLWAWPVIVPFEVVHWFKRRK